MDSAAASGRSSAAIEIVDPAIVYPEYADAFPLSRVERRRTVGARGEGCRIARSCVGTTGTSKRLASCTRGRHDRPDPAWQRGLQWSDRRIAGRRAFAPGRQWRGSSCVCRYSHRFLARHHRASAMRRWRYDEHSYPHRGGELSYGTPAGGTAVLGTSRFRIECPTCP